MSFLLLVTWSVVLQNGASTDASLSSRVQSIIAGTGVEVAVAFSTVDGSSQLLIDPGPLS